MIKDLSLQSSSFFNFINEIWHRTNNNLFPNGQTGAHHADADEQLRIKVEMDYVWNLSVWTPRRRALNTISIN